MGIVFIPPMVFEALSSCSPDNETDSPLMRQIEEATNSTLMMSTPPALSTAFLILGLIGLGIEGLLKNKLSNYLAYLVKANSLFLTYLPNYFVLFCSCSTNVGAGLATPHEGIP